MDGSLPWGTLSIKTPPPSEGEGIALRIIRNYRVAGGRNPPNYVIHRYATNSFFFLIVDIFGMYQSTANNMVKAHVPTTLVSTALDFLPSFDLSLFPFLHTL